MSQVAAKPAAMLAPDGSREPRVVVAIATYNGRHLLEIVMPSLAEQTFRDFRVVVVDDASNDDTLVWLDTQWPDAQVIAHEHNRGVTAALNSCLQTGRSEYVALLNNDVELDRDCLRELISALDAHPEAAVAAAKLINFHNRDVIDGAGDVYEWRGLADRRGHGRPDEGQYDRPQPIFGACAGAAVYRRSAIDRVGLFDEDFFAFQEDVDWSFRAQLLGYACRYVPSAVVYHMGSETLGRGMSDFTLYQNWRNGIWVVLKDHPAGALLRHGHEFVTYQAQNYIWARNTGRARIFMRVWRDVLRALPSVLRKRKEVQASRTVGMGELERVIGADV